MGYLRSVIRLTHWVAAAAVVVYFPPVGEAAAAVVVYSPPMGGGGIFPSCGRRRRRWYIPLMWIWMGVSMFVSIMSHHNFFSRKL